MTFGLIARNLCADMSNSNSAKISPCLSLVFTAIFAGGLAATGQTNEGPLPIPASILLPNPPPVYFRNSSKAAPAPGLLQSLPQSPLPATNFLARTAPDSDVANERQMSILPCIPLMD